MNEPALATDDEIMRIAENHMPQWAKACGHEDQALVILNQRDFSKSGNDMLLLAIAIKYAGIARKNVSVIL